MADSCWLIGEAKISNSSNKYIYIYIHIYRTLYTATRERGRRIDRTGQENQTAYGKLQQLSLSSSLPFAVGASQSTPETATPELTTEIHLQALGARCMKNSY
jgi:hypothetical protein